MFFLFSICSFSHPWTSLVQLSAFQRERNRQILFWELSVPIPVRNGEVALEERKMVVFGCELITFSCSNIQQETNTGKIRIKSVPESEVLYQHQFVRCSGLGKKKICPRKHN